MPKNPPPASGRSKIRVFFVDADLAPGDMQQLTETLTNAIRPTHMITRAPALRLNPAANGKSDMNGTEVEQPDTEDFDQEFEAEVEDEASITREPAKPRKYRSPKIVANLEPNAGGKPFEEFATERGNPSEHVARFLVAAYWLDEYAKIKPASVDHVYTCYKFAGWTFDLTDPVFPFKKLKKDGMGDTKKAMFTIGHIGRSRVEKMKPETAKA